LKPEKPLSEYLTLKDLSLQIKRGEFVIVVGDVGSGKSSLMHALIGDMIYLPPAEINLFGGVNHPAKPERFEQLTEVLLGEGAADSKFDAPIKVEGSIAYVEQSAWIQSKTVRDNILFGQEFDA